jgi:gluconolactonase
MDQSPNNKADDAATPAGDARRVGMNRRVFLSAAAASAAAAGSIGSAVAATDKFGRDRDWSGTEPLSYPEPAWEVKDKRFTGMLTQSPLQRIWHGVGTDTGYWCEGPVWMSDWGCLLWSDIPNHRVLRWTEDDGHISVYQSESGYANGHTRDNQGRLIAMEHDTRRVRRREYDGSWTILCDSFEGKRLNAPNDVAVHQDGSIFFSDPGYGIMNNYEGHVAAFELPTRVYRIDPAGHVTVAAEGPMRRPNGVCFSPDYKRLYVVDSAQTDGNYPNHIVMFDVQGTKLSNPRVFAEFAPGGTDGIRCDTEGNVWCSWGWGGPDTNGVRVHHPDGAVLAILHTPEVCANLCFGGSKRTRLFICGSSSLYAVYVNAIGHSLG